MEVTKQREAALDMVMFRQVLPQQGSDRTFAMED